ncbi:LURP-one-related family protein [Actinomadura barringtoniae]|uniref:LURP-one-related family protein n=1 Tax=Actinomadura barringtoniae TaxID=1427535 RepID=A0A939PJ06_9ACTN|nr:LURP-one-related family protein [Actinomadura barringtoniae]MBO2453167.1 LURP-one-related family protein [Actinomadura barringtoniae]
MKYKVRDRVFGFGDDSWVEDEQGDKVFLLDGKAFRMRQVFELKDRDDRVVAEIKEKRLSVRDTMIIERDGERLATVHKKMIHLVHDRFEIELEGGGEWTAKGDILDKEYEIKGDHGTIAKISRKWFSIRDTYGIEVEPGMDVPLVLAAAIAVEAISEDD